MHRAAAWSRTRLTSPPCVDVPAATARLRGAAVTGRASAQRTDGFSLRRFVVCFISSGRRLFLSAAVVGAVIRDEGIG